MNPSGDQVLLRPTRFIVALCAAMLLFVTVDSARADSITDLSARLSDSSEKTRIAAAVALGRLHDERALKPLVLALKDQSRVVRAVAASALGELADNRALPALRRATQDEDKTVRRKAVEAIALIRDQASRQATTASKQFAPRRRQIRSAHYKIDSRESPIYSPRKPELFVRVRSVSDDTPGRLRQALRKERATMTRTLLDRQLEENHRVTSNDTLASELGLEGYSVDLSITRLQRQERGPYVELDCEIRIAISNHRGKMISFLTGGAKVQVPKRTFRRQYEAQMRIEALENAVKSVHQDLVQYLRNKPS